MTEPEPNPQPNKLPQAAIYERLFDKKWAELPIFDLKNIPLIPKLMTLEGPQIWVPFSHAVKKDLRYDCRINLPPNLDKIVLIVMLNNTRDVPGTVPPVDHIKHLLQPDEELGAAAQKILSWWNTNATMGAEPVEIVAVKSNTGQPRALIYYHKGLLLPEKSKVFNLIPDPLSSQLLQVN